MGRFWEKMRLQKSIASVSRVGVVLGELEELGVGKRELGYPIATWR